MSTSKIKTVQNKKSSELNADMTGPKLPTPNQLTYGEIAINYAADNETISIKNSNNDIVTFSADNASPFVYDKEVMSLTRKDLSDLPEDAGAVSFGILNETSGTAATTFGMATKTVNTYEVATGCYNVSINDDDEEVDGGFHEHGFDGSRNKTIFSIGNSENEMERHNAFQVMQSGDVYIPDTSNTSVPFSKTPMMNIQGSMNEMKNDIQTLKEGLMEDEEVIANTFASVRIATGLSEDVQYKSTNELLKDCDNISDAIDTLCKLYTKLEETVQSLMPGPPVVH